MAETDSVPSTTLRMLTLLVNISDEGYDDGNATSGNGSDAGEPAYVRSLPEIIILSVLLSSIIIMTILGNLLVCITIITNRRLRNPTNFFILALAAADLMLGILVLPFSALNTLAANWPLGPIFCNIYSSFDVMLCTVSILTLFAISLDRYFAVTKPMKYIEKMNSRIVYKTNIGIWAFSLVLAFVPIHLGWNTPSGDVQNFAAPEFCAFELNKPYVLLVALGTYFTPLIVMCSVYLKVLRITKHQVRKINRLTRVGSNRPHHRPSRSDTETMLNGGQNGSAASEKQGHHNKNMASDTKATVTLASVVLAFAICWVPYFALFTAKPFVSKPFNLHLDLFTLWLGYVNSTVNPFLYAFYNSSFRDGFKKILCREWMKRSALKKHRLSNIRTRRSGSSSETSELSVLQKNNICTTTTLAGQ